MRRRACRLFRRQTWSRAPARPGPPYVLADQVEGARASADCAGRLARGRGQRGYEAWALRLLGEVAAHHQRPEVGMRPRGADLPRGFSSGAWLVMAGFGF